METSSDLLREHGHVALTALERVVRDQPVRLSEDLAEVTRRLVRLRDDLIDRRRKGDASERDRDWLERTNAILSSTIGCEYPIKSIQWDRLCQARDALREMLDRA